MKNLDCCGKIYEKKIISKYTKTEVKHLEQNICVFC